MCLGGDFEVMFPDSRCVGCEFLSALRWPAGESATRPLTFQFLGFLKDSALEVLLVGISDFLLCSRAMLLLKMRLEDSIQGKAAWVAQGRNRIFQRDTSLVEEKVSVLWGRGRFRKSAAWDFTW